eukprot:4277633-Ditylum_brightwellii.AAC.1
MTDQNRLQEYLLGMNELVETVKQYKCSCFAAILNVNGTMIPSSQEEYDKSAVNSFNIFDFVSSSFKGMYIQIPGCNVEEKFQ